MRQDDQYPGQPAGLRAGINGEQNNDRDIFQQVEEPRAERQDIEFAHGAVGSISSLKQPGDQKPKEK